MSYGDVIVVREPTAFGQILGNEQFPFTFNNVALFANDELVASGTGTVNDKYSNLRFHAETEKIMSIMFSGSDVRREGDRKAVTTRANDIPEYFRIVIRDASLTIGDEKRNCVLTSDKCGVNSNLSFTLGEDIECELIPYANEKGELVALNIVK